MSSLFTITNTKSKNFSFESRADVCATLIIPAFTLCLMSSLVYLTAEVIFVTTMGIYPCVLYKYFEVQISLFRYE